MESISKRLKEFNSVKGYFLSDKRALNYINTNLGIWDKHTLNGKIGALGINRLVPDHQYGYFLQSIADDDVRQAVMDGDFSIFKILFHELSYLDEAKFIITRFLCAHRPNYFPIWDVRKTLINNWQLENGNLTYLDLKLKIDDFMTENELSGLDYFLFNKLLWYCE
ncbi:MAG: hypothetical protein R8N23_19900 [Reichenbachiella sp.]|uniref:hypothetical protein n=1 Tax=Reichenbachiella sp. TaxID=2184521 RepID=UPI00296659FA|nr:hypothetical protein [Reichenbachiella sp.]MDW3212143.1 hypothetical protein [Reichenbachiella sp.]